MSEYKYDVAFSFLKEDEDLAIKLNELLQDRLSTFLYSRKQEEIAGTDGEKTFNEVFGSNSRIVVVLYRSTWGSTPWTRIEETAIKNRAFDDGYDFAIFIPLGQPPKVPKWLPKNRMWIGLERWGVDGAAGVIEARVQQADGKVHQETVEEHAIRLKRQIETEQERKQFLSSDDGVKSANKEFSYLATQINLTINTLSSKVGFDVASKQDINGGAFQWIEIYDIQFCLCLEWSSNFSNTLKDSRLDITLLKGRPRRPNRLTIYEPEKLQHLLFDFDLDQSRICGWRNTNDSKFLTTDQMKEFCVNLLIDYIHEHELGNRD